jgi:hypothetical protein
MSANIEPAANPTDTKPHRDAPASADRFRNFDTIAPIVLFIVVLAVYLKTLCPTIWTDDCGEIATAVATGGVMHPPGYPLYTLIGRVFIAVIPFGEPAYRLGLISALAAAAAVAMSFRLARLAGASRTWSLGAAAGFAFSLSLWRQATKVETYALNALLVTLILGSAGNFSLHGRKRDLMLAGLFCGLGLTNHLSAACAIPAAVWMVIPNLRQIAHPWRTCLIAAVLACAPLGLYGLLWLDAAHHPGGQIWGDTDSWRRFMLHITAARYRGYMAGQGMLGMAQRDLIDLPSLLWRNLAWFLIGIVPGVARGLWNSRTRRIHFAFLIAFAAYFIETTTYGILNIFEYYTPIILLLCVWAGVGMDGVLAGIALRTRMPARLVAGLQCTLAALVCFTGLLAHWSACDRSHAVYIRDLAINTLRTMPTDAVVLSVGDNRNFPMWYAQDVLGIRRDVTVVPRNMLTGFDMPDGRQEMGWLLWKLQRDHPDLVNARAIMNRCASDRVYALTEGPAWDIAKCGTALGRPLLLTDVEPQDLQRSFLKKPVLAAIPGDLALEPYGLANIALPRDMLPGIAQVTAIDAAVSHAVRIEYAPDALMQDEPDGNVTNILYAQMESNLSSLLSRSTNFPAAIEQQKEATELDPTPQNYDYLGFLYSMTNHFNQAVAAYTTAVSLSPENDDYYNDLLQAKKQVEREKQLGARVS